ncbi:uncharacterized protein LOC114251635 [Bombyx mandarina]|uniref:Uncharacterized protein LOC114251635 n=1 Tax=Bombyx mandarina TaxID=7092 RepID=A0A6J2KNN3_BOMMA|nr:uncharacterized protein LOC114251635 [Bombyx mandarina]
MPKDKEINENSNEVQENRITEHNNEDTANERKSQNNEIHIDMTRLGDDAKGTENERKNPSIVVYQFYGAQNQNDWGMSGGNTFDNGAPPLEYDPKTRNDFVRFVFIIVFIMLMCTASFTVLVFITPDMKIFFQRIGLVIGIPAMILIIGLSFVMSCSECARKMPCNIVCLVLAVIGMSTIVSFITVHYNTEILMYAMLATAVVVFVCILLACSNFDFTKWFIYVIVISTAFSVIVMIVGVTTLITNTHMKSLDLGLLIVGTLINVVILVLELQTILGGRSVELHEDDYAMGAFLLYISIVDIFLQFVQILGILGDT